jgi:hypothetical protein
MYDSFSIAFYCLNYVLHGVKHWYINCTICVTLALDFDHGFRAVK